MVTSSQPPRPPSRRPRIDERLLRADADGVEIAQTHVSSLAFRGDLVHKRKRPVRLHFVDLSTDELREAMCEREVALNRRLSPDVYLGIEDIVDASGTVIDHAVLMRRMPAERRLSTLVRHGTPVSRWLRDVATLLADLHRRAATTEQIASVATQAALRALWTSSLDDLVVAATRPVDAALVDDIIGLVDRYISGRDALFTERIRHGRIVDGHGDLVADDIFCLDDGPRILDCLEFDERLRWGDVLNDVAFLAMDLEHLARADLAEEFLRDYHEASGESHPSTLEHHYIAYRALVRAKISFLQGTTADDEHAHAYLTQVHRHLVRGRVRLVVVGGLPGTGKSTIAAGIGDALGWPVLRSDVIRKELLGLDPREHRPAAFGSGIYAGEVTDHTYATLALRAQELLGNGECVILDATFASERHRAIVREVADELAADLLELRCLLPAAVAAERMARRAAASSDASDADETVAAVLSQHFDPWPAAATVNTLPPRDDAVRSALIRVDASPPPARPAQ